MAVRLGWWVSNSVYKVNPSLFCISSLWIDTNFQLWPRVYISNFRTSSFYLIYLYSLCMCELEILYFVNGNRTNYVYTFFCAIFPVSIYTSILACSLDAILFCKNGLLAIVFQKDVLNNRVWYGNYYVLFGSILI